MHIEERIDKKRGCGYRKPGGKYLVSAAAGAPCGNLPVYLDICPCCGNGIKPARGWTWIDPDPLILIPSCNKTYCAFCPFTGHFSKRIGLIWIGEKYYPTPGKFMEEVARMGISRRINQIPRGFKVGETWIALAHRKVPKDFGEEYMPAIFTAFIPEAIEYILTGQETEKELQKMVDQGIHLVKITKQAQEEMFNE